MVRRCGWYHAVPSRPFSPHPENMSAKRRIGVSSPALVQPRGLPREAKRPRCAWSATRLVGEVAVSRAYPYWATFVTGAGGFRFAGRNLNAWPMEGELGS